MRVLGAQYELGNNMARYPRPRHSVDYFFLKRRRKYQGAKCKNKGKQKIGKVLTTLIIKTQIIEGKQQLVLPYLFLKKV